MTSSYVNTRRKVMVSVRCNWTIARFQGAGFAGGGTIMFAALELRMNLL